MRPVEHVAAEHDGRVQRCERCGCVLVDNGPILDGQVGSPGGPPVANWWEVGSPVWLLLMGPNVATSGHRVPEWGDPVPCSPELAYEQPERDVVGNELGELVGRIVTEDASDMEVRLARDLLRETNARLRLESIVRQLRGRISDMEEELVRA